MSIKYSELESLYEMIITRKNGNRRSYKYAAIKNGEIVVVTAKEFFRLERKINIKDLKKTLEQL